jgi:hypothetical protein
MSWLFSAALLPIVLCGVMCVGGPLLAALGVRRAARNGRGRSTADTDSRTSENALDR